MLKNRERLWYSFLFGIVPKLQRNCQARALVLPRSCNCETPERRRWEEFIYSEFSSNKQPFQQLDFSLPIPARLLMLKNFCNHLCRLMAKPLICSSLSELLQRHKATGILVSAMPLPEQKVLCMCLKWVKANKMRCELLFSHSAQVCHEEDVQQQEEKIDVWTKYVIMHIYHYMLKQHLVLDW